VPAFDVAKERHRSPRKVMYGLPIVGVGVVVGAGAVAVGMADVGADVAVGVGGAEELLTLQPASRSRRVKATGIRTLVPFTKRRRACRACVRLLQILSLSGMSPSLPMCPDSRSEASDILSYSSADKRNH